MDATLLQLLSQYVHFTVTVGTLTNTHIYHRGWWDGPYGTSLPYSEHKEFSDFYNEHWPENGGILMNGTTFKGIDHQIFATIIPYDEDGIADYEHSVTATKITGIT